MGLRSWLGLGLRGTVRVRGTVRARFGFGSAFGLGLDGHGQRLERRRGAQGRVRTRTRVSVRAGLSSPGSLARCCRSRSRLMPGG